MVEELTAEVTRLEDIQRSITSDGLQVLEHLDNTSTQSKAEVQALLTATVRKRHNKYKRKIHVMYHFVDDNDNDNICL